MNVVVKCLLINITKTNTSSTLDVWTKAIENFRVIFVQGRLFHLLLTHVVRNIDISKVNVKYIK